MIDTVYNIIYEGGKFAAKKSVEGFKRWFYIESIYIIDSCDNAK